MRVNSASVVGPWKSKAPPIMAFFMWTSVLEKILTLDNLRKKNIIVMEWCCICKCSGESIDHLLLHCEVPMELWNMVFQLFGVTWVMPSWMKECLGSWRRQRGNCTVLQIWRMTHLCVMCYGDKGMHEVLRTGNLDS